MARPVKARRICGIPGRMRFGPLEAGTGPGTDQIEAETGPESDQIISLTLEEYETIRLIDYSGGMRRPDGCGQDDGSGRIPVREDEDSGHAGGGKRSFHLRRELCGMSQGGRML